MPPFSNTSFSICFGGLFLTRRHGLANGFYTRGRASMTVGVSSETSPNGLARAVPRKGVCTEERGGGQVGAFTRCYACVDDGFS